VTYRIEWRPHARKAFLALDKPVRRRIDEGQLIVLVLDAGHRSEIYRR
jgi:mRNA-degrading endonuclease RelE of RelBE toxin-antitoxin system